MLIVIILQSYVIVKFLYQLGKVVSALTMLMDAKKLVVLKELSVLICQLQE